MSSTSRIEPLLRAARLGALDTLVVYPPKIYVSTTLPRALLQVLFLSYIGYYAAGAEGRQFAFIGAVAQVVVLATIVRGPDILFEDRSQGTLARLRLGQLPVSALVLARWWVFVVEGLFEALVSIAVIGPLVGQSPLLPRFFAAIGLLFLIAVSTVGLGLVVAAYSLTQRVDVIITNLVSYASMVLCGVLAPLHAFGSAGALAARILPLTNGLLALRLFISHKSWTSDAGLEVLVGLVWLGLGVLLLELQLHRSRRLGSDDLL